MPDPITIDRPPRIQPELPFGEIPIPKPPDKQPDTQARLVQVALPLVTIIGYVLVSTLGGSGRSPWLLVPMALSVVASAAFSIYSFRREEQRRAEAEQAYADRLVVLNKEMHHQQDMQRRHYGYNYPDPSGSLQIIERSRSAAQAPPTGMPADPNQPHRSEARVWERRTSDADFGVVRLGMGVLPSTMVYVLGEVSNFDDPLTRAAMKLADDSRYVSDIPVIISLRPTPEQEDEQDDEQHPPTPSTHALALAGDNSSVYSFIRALLGHFVTFHAPGDARLYVLAGAKAEWEWAQKLPHCQAGEHGNNLLFLDAIDKPDPALPQEEGGNPREQFLEGLRKMLSQRKIRLQEREEQQDAANPVLPFCLIVVDLLDTNNRIHKELGAIENDAAIAILLAEGAALGATVVFLVPERAKAPSGCTAVIEVARSTPPTNSKADQSRTMQVFRYAEVGVNSFRYIGQADSLSCQGMERLVELLARLEARQGPGSGLPGSVPFLELAGYGDNLQRLRSDAGQRWHESRGAKYAGWLRVKLGLMAGNKPRTLIFSAKHDGVHGVVAGSTGSGKSELLISLISGLAVNYDPSVLNFVLVDYKGGGAFKAFEQLPHCVDIITNLAADGVTRMFTAIQAEMQRRQQLNAQTNTKNIVEYRQRNLHITHQPYPFLFIIIDEFAEMIADRSEYRAQLESITRVGRAQGVSLILAAQRPSGVTDQMRSNIKFRICLRVESPGESREMLRRTEAAYLPSGVPGRGYLQVGNEEIELIQVAYTGGVYRDPDRPPVANVLWPVRNPAGYNAVQDQEPPELYKAIIETLDQLSQVEQCPPQLAPWPPALPQHLALTAPLISDAPGNKPITSRKYLSDEDIGRITLAVHPADDLTLNPAVGQWLSGGVGWRSQLNWEQYAMRPVVGLIDNPYAARQHPLIIDLPRGHTVIFGAAGWGKSSFVRTLVLSLAATHSLDQFHAYLLDLGGRNLAALDQLPHVGALITPDEPSYEERVRQLLNELERLVDQRKQLFKNTRTDDLIQYNQAKPDQTLPGILLVIDNLVEFTETFGQQADDPESIMAKFISLARQCKPYGVHLVITASRLGELSSQLLSLFTERLALKLADPGEYRAIVGGNVEEIGDIPGRGYIRLGLQPLSFQVARLVAGGPGSAAGAASELAEQDRLIARIRDYVTAETAAGRRFHPVVRIGALDKTVLLRQILAQRHTLDLSADFRPQLKLLTKQAWAASIDRNQADWLRVALGMKAGNQPLELALEARRDGVHGMIAGGTGAGKSELLMSLITSLALSYDPSILNFVLVDYKGGGAFKPFEQLPHCVDIITNLNKAAVRRVFTAIRAEMERRQKLNADTKTKDIIDYRRKNLHQTHKPYPHLFIIIDEYAEMISDSPEFGDELDSITRVGRSIGVNLLLASQRPTGVSDQMRANIKLRICLRVEDMETSRELLRRPDAALLPSGMPGRGYIQVGNENIELVQVAYVGEEYAYAPPAENGERPRFYEVAVQIATELLQGERPRAPWPPFLPSALTFAARYKASEQQGTAEQWHRLSPALHNWQAGRGQWPGLDWNQTALRPVIGLLDDPFNARQTPLEIDLVKGHAILFGASGWGKTTFLRSLAISLSSTHSPAELHLHVLDLGGRSLEMLEALPQVGTVITPDERGYEERVQQLWRELNNLIDERKRLFSAANVATLIEYNSSGLTRIEPAVVVLIDNIAEFIDTFGTVQANDPDNPLETLIALARQGRTYGIHFVITAARPNAISSKIYSLFTERFTLRLADAGEYSAVVAGSLAEVESIPGRGYMRGPRQPLAFQTALIPGAVDSEGRVRGEAARIRELGEQMRLVSNANPVPFRRPLQIKALPSSSSYRDLLAEQFQISSDRASFQRELPSAVRQIWAHNATAQHADWLRVALGVASGGRPRTLRLEARHDGVHGMIAGGTGSGKSELLMTLIVGLALNYPPDILNFVLVDYKGGGAFKPFERLPHCVDIVTNLDKSAVHRMFTAIEAEMQRRQKLNADTNTKDIIDYRRKNLHQTHKPYPHLFIIIDEYAEMIDDNPDYRQQLDSITRVGRSIGVNLLLASQRPRGVSDQMRANIKLRICLRVEELETSRELLRRPDAALLPNGMPGRGYLQIGNENIELVQVSWTGETLRDEAPPTVLWPARTTKQASGPDEPPTFYSAAVDLAAALTGEQPVRRPWPGFLPERLSLETMLTDATSQDQFVIEPAVGAWINAEISGLWGGIDWHSGAMCAAAGLIDDPAQARQFPLTFDMASDHLVVLGDAGCGKSTLLRSLAVSLAATHHPDELHMYALDLGGRSLSSLQALPHVGTVIYADEERFDERLQRLVDILGRTAAERQRIISEAGAASLYEFNARFPDRAMPAILVLIDNFAELQENYEALIDATLVPLVRRALGAGMSFVVATNIPNSMSNRLYNLFTRRITFRQTNTDRYLDIVGRGAVEFRDTPGRGYLRYDQRALLFQAALPAGVAAAGQPPLRPEAELLHDLAAAMVAELARRGGARRKPDPIAVLGESVMLARLLAQAPAPSGRRIQSVVGQDANLQPVLIDLQQQGPHMAIVGPPLSGKSTALRSWVLGLASRYSPARVRLVLIDFQRRLFDYGGMRRLDELPHVITAISEPGMLKDLLANLEKEGKALEETLGSQPLVLVIDNFDDFYADLEQQRLNNSLSALVQRHGRSGLHCIASFSTETGPSELRKRIQANNFGIALRNIPALEGLRVQKHPASLRQKELPVGRGFLVRSGQTTLLHVATPVENDDPAFLHAQTDDQDLQAQRMVLALDGWIERLCAQHSEPRATWSEASAVASRPPLSPKQQQQLQRVRKVLELAAQRELQRLRQGDGSDLTRALSDLIIERLIDPELWNDETRYRELLKEALFREQEAKREPRQVELFEHFGIDDLLKQIEPHILNGHAS